MKDWKESGVLVKDSKPAIYVYHQLYTVDGQEYCRKGFMAGLRSGSVRRRHGLSSRADDERSEIGSSHADDRVQDEFQPDFRALSDADNEVQNLLEAAIIGVTPLEATDHLGVVNRMWIVDDPEVVSQVVKLMGPKPIFIADGHHRYETACNYRKQLAEQGELTSDHPPTMS